MTEKTLGQVAYEAYWQPDPTWPWDELVGPSHEQWECAAQAVLDHAAQNAHEPERPSVPRCVDGPAHNFMRLNKARVFCSKCGQLMRQGT